MSGCDDTGVLRHLVTRSRMLQACRGFFEAAGFLEVETPVRIPAPAAELQIDAPSAGGAWLRTSPELHMKRLLAAGCTRLYQIGPCFRVGERGRRHNPEFTLLEWYRTPADCWDILRDCEALLRQVVSRVTGGSRVTWDGRGVDVALPWVRLTVREAFRQYAGWDPVAAFDADRFDHDLVAKVEPALAAYDRPVVLVEYPAPVAALARLKPGDPAVAERWELYVGGLELANAYSELTDPAQQRARFVACNAERQAAGRAVYPLDEHFLAALERGLPPCGGIALGIDRLAMVVCGAASIDEVRPFCQPIGELW